MRDYIAWITNPDFVAIKSSLDKIMSNIWDKDIFKNTNLTPRYTVDSIPNERDSDGKYITLKDAKLPKHKDSIAAYVLSREFELDPNILDISVFIRHKDIDLIGDTLYIFEGSDSIPFLFFFESKEDINRIKKLCRLNAGSYRWLPYLFYYDESSKENKLYLDYDIYVISSRYSVSTSSDTLGYKSPIDLTPYSSVVSQHTLYLLYDYGNASIVPRNYYNNYKIIVYDSSGDGDTTLSLRSITPNQIVEVHNLGKKELIIYPTDEDNSYNISIKGSFILRPTQYLKGYNYNKNDLKGVRLDTFAEREEYLTGLSDLGLNTNIFIGKEIVNRQFIEYTLIVWKKLNEKLYDPTDLPNGVTFIKHRFGECLYDGKTIGIETLLQNTIGKTLYVKGFDKDYKTSIGRVADVDRNLSFNVMVQDEVIAIMTFTQIFYLWLLGANILNMIDSYFMVEDLDRKKFGMLNIRAYSSDVKFHISYMEKEPFRLFRNMEEYNAIISLSTPDRMLRLTSYTAKLNCKEALEKRTTFRAKVNEFKTLISLDKIVKSSASVGLKNGAEVIITNAERFTASKFKSVKVIMDNIFSASDYLVFSIRKLSTGETYKIENSTFYSLLKSGQLKCNNAETDLIKNTVLWLLSDYDKDVIETIKEYNNNKLLLGVTEGGEDITFAATNKANNFKMYLSHISGEDLFIPSFVTDVELITYNTSIANIGVMAGASEPITIGEQYFNILTAFTSYSNKVAINNFITSKEVLINKELVEQEIYSRFVPIRNIELPKGIKINLVCAANRADREYTHRVLIRENSIAHISYFDEVEVTKDSNVTVSYGCKKLILHGGTLGPYTCSLENLLSEVIIDGGMEYIDPLAFNPHVEVKITCINGGAYKFINQDSKAICDLYTKYEEEINSNTLSNEPSTENVLTDKRNIISENKHYYSELFITSYNYYKSNLDSYSQLIGVPIAIDLSGFVTILTSDNTTVNLNISQIKKLLDENKLTLSHKLPSGESINFIEKLPSGELYTLVFYEGINNKYCDTTFRLLLPTDAPIKFSHSPSLVIAYTEEQWKYGKIKSLPKSLLTANTSSTCAIYFDGLLIGAIKDNIVVFSPYQNACYYSRYFGVDLSIDMFGYKKLYFYRTLYQMYDSEHVKHAWFPASHEYNLEFKAKGFGKNVVEIGGNSHYGRFNSLKAPLFPAEEINLIPGIGENCTIHFKPQVYSGDNYSSYSQLYTKLEILNIFTPTEIYPYALTRIYNKSEALATIRRDLLEYHFIELNSYTNARVHITNCLFNKIIAHSGILIIDAEDVGDANADTYFSLFSKDPEIEIKGDAKLVVINLDVCQIGKLLRNHAFKFASVLLQHAINLDELLLDTSLMEMLESVGENNLKHANTYTDTIPEIVAEPYRTLDNIQTLFDNADMEDEGAEDTIEDAPEEITDIVLPDNDFYAEPETSESLENTAINHEIDEGEYLKQEEVEEYNKLKKADIEKSVELLKLRTLTLEQFFKDLEANNTITFNGKGDDDTTEAFNADILESISNSIKDEISDEDIYTEEIGRGIKEELLQNIKKVEQVILEVAAYDSGRCKVTNLETGEVKILRESTVAKLEQNVKYRLLYNN